jgi:ankyrin repeat protein
MFDFFTRRPNRVFEAARRGDHPQVLRYLGEGHSPNQRGTHGQTALHYACGLRQLALAQDLLRFQANPNAQDRRGYTPLLVAVYVGDAKLVSYLLKHGAHYHIGFPGGYTPLCLAASLGHLPIITLLVEAGAPLAARYNQHFCPCVEAVLHGQFAAYNLLLRYHHHRLHSSLAAPPTKKRTFEALEIESPPQKKNPRIG